MCVTHWLQNAAVLYFIIILLESAESEFYWYMQNLEFRVKYIYFSQAVVTLPYFWEEIQIKEDLGFIYF